MARQVLLVALIVFTQGILLVAGQACTPNPCKNGGSCGEASGDYNCTCVEGWKGTDCEEACATDSDCKNGGTCKADKTCTCATGYTGDFCGTEIKECDSDPCQNAGTCTDAVASYTCLCATGWTGTNCESEACVTGNECDNGGTCKPDKTCSCATGYTGDLCGTVACDNTGNVCANGGTCGEDETCTCAPGYTEDLCELDIDECASNPCQETEVCENEVAGYTCTESGASLSTASCLILALALALTKMATD